MIEKIKSLTDNTIEYKEYQNKFKTSDLNC